MAQPPQFCPPPNLQRLLLQHLAEHLPRARVLKPESMQLYSLADTAENIRKHLNKSERCEHVRHVMYRHRNMSVDVCRRKKMEKALKGQRVVK
jgi:hypothetical protein